MTNNTTNLPYTTCPIHPANNEISQDIWWQTTKSVHIITPATHCTVHNTQHMHIQCYGLCMQPHKPEPPTHSMSTAHQARWVGQLTSETRHTVRPTRLTYSMTQPLFLQRREKQWQWYNLLHNQSCEAGTVTTTRTHPHNTSTHILPTNSVLWWAHHQRDIDKKIFSEMGSRQTLAEPTRTIVYHDSFLH